MAAPGIGHCHDWVILGVCPHLVLIISFLIVGRVLLLESLLHPHEATGVGSHSP